MKTKKLSFIIGILAFVIALSTSIASAQNNGGNNSPPANEPKNAQNQEQHQHQNQDCVADCNHTQQQNQNQNQANDGTGTQNQEQHQNQNQDCVADCNHTQQQNQNQNQNQVDDCPNCPISTIELPDDVIAAMNAGLLDEYMAYEVYSAIIAQFGEIIPFVNIQSAEAWHIWAWERMFAKYDLELPAYPSPDVPIFETVADACAYALAFETENVALYEGMLETVADYNNLRHLVTALQSASLNHHVPALEVCAAQ